MEKEKKVNEFFELRKELVECVKPSYYAEIGRHYRPIPLDNGCYSLDLLDVEIESDEVEWSEYEGKSEKMIDEYIALAKELHEMKITCFIDPYKNDYIDEEGAVDIFKILLHKSDFNF